MVFKFFPSLKSREKGITLIEIIVVIFMIALFTMILVADFPEILRQFALSRVTYKLAQDMKGTQDLGLSGVPINNIDKEAIKVQGYGIYIPTTNTGIKRFSAKPSNQFLTKYIIYADVSDGELANDQKYSGCTDYQSCICDQEPPPIVEDCVIKIIDVSLENQSLIIKNVVNSPSGGNINIASGMSINFSPPNPTTKIEDDKKNSYSEIGIVFGLKSGTSTRMVLVNTAGLINVQ